LVYDRDRHVVSRELLEHFNAWLTERRHQPWSDRTFNKRIEEHHETSARQVVRKVVRRDLARVSRPPTALGTDLPGQYHARLGIRFRTDTDPAGGGPPSDGDRVSAEGTGRGDNPELSSQPSQQPPPASRTLPELPSQPSQPPSANSKTAGETTV